MHLSKPPSNGPQKTYAIRVRGIVQGVGFRPTVWTIATSLDLRGDVRNDGEGVLIHVRGALRAIEIFLSRLRTEAPPLSRIDAIEVAETDTGLAGDDFRIVSSTATAPATGIVPDAATCPACIQDIKTCENRRHRYAFTNCTHCGPRLTIVNAIPYDRVTTSMSDFTMCSACQGEYDNPADRRFHAQPNACPACGPTLTFERLSDRKSRLVDPIASTVSVLRSGGIVAIKGLGGFHLSCDALSEAAVAALRARKRRDAKPFAIMAPSVEAARTIAVVDDDAAAAMATPAAPIVLCPVRAGALPEAIAPRLDEVGIMLPYTPVHHLVMMHFGGPLVMTSGNLSDAPQITQNDDARTQLAGVADAVLFHDRQIVNRVDDSLVRVENGRPRLLRRARGYAPAPLPLPAGFEGAPRVLAMGPELKSTFCMLTASGFVLSQHIGDLEDAETVADYHRLLALYRDIFAFDPQVIAVDRHPDYASTVAGRKLAGETGAEIQMVDHHHAHLAAAMAENGWPRDAGPVIGIALDGLGMGPDDTLWGGEILMASYTAAKRLASLPAIALPGGATAMKEPWRNLFAHLHHAVGWAEALESAGDSLTPSTLPFRQTDVLATMIDRGVNSPRASSAGRLFDAVAALLGLDANRVAYEGQAAMALEALARTAEGRVEPWPMPVRSQDGVLRFDLRPLWMSLLTDLADNADPALLAFRFHVTLAAGFAREAVLAAKEAEIDAIALSGGVLQNRLLETALIAEIEAAGVRVLSHAKVPANDGGLALGQAVIAAARRAT